MAGKIALDFKKFKHVKSDDHTTTLQHADGHLLTLAHKALSPDNQKQLHALAAIPKQDAMPSDRAEGKQDKQMFQSGGNVGNKNTSYLKGMEPKEKSLGDKLSEGMDNLKKAVTPETPSSASPQYQSPANGSVYPLAEGGPVRKMYAEGDLVDTDPQQPMTQDPSIPPQVAQPPSAPTPSVPDPGLQAQKDLYNQKLAGAGAAVSADDMFGPNGEAPKNPVNPTLWGQVENSGQAEQLASEEVAKRKLTSEADSSVQQQQAAHDKAVAQNVVNAKLGLPAVPDPGAPAEVNTPVASAPQAQAAVADSKTPQAATQAKQQPVDSHDPMSMLTSGYNQAMSGIQAGAEAKGALGQQQADVLQKQQQIQQAAQDSYKQSYNALEQERQAHMQDIKDGYIDPNQYWTGHKDPNTGEQVGGHSKIAAGIGMILAGFNPTSSPNAAVNFLKFQMEQNLQGQARNLETKNNLLSANLRQFGNMKDAADMTRIMQHDVMDNQLAQAAAKAQNPMAQAAAQQARGQLSMDSAKLFQEFAMRRAMMEFANSGQNQPGGVEHMMNMARVLNPEMAKEMETRAVPGIGANGGTALASVPVPESVRQQIVSSKSVNDLMNKSLQFSAQHKGTLSPQLRAQAETIQNQLIGQVKQAQHDGVYKPSEADFLMEQIGGSPASFMANLSSVPKIKTMQSIKQQEYGNLLKTYGLPAQQLPQSQGSQYKMVNGVKYMRGPTGQAIPVK